MQPKPESASFLISVIIGFLRQNGGEFRIKRNHLDIDEKMGYYCDYDAATNEMVFRLATREGLLTFVTPQQEPAWIDSASSQPKRPTPMPPQPQNRSVSNLDDNEKLRDLENKMLRRRIARMVIEEQREKTAG